MSFQSSMSCSLLIDFFQTTALKILAGMEDATSGIGLVAGYEVEAERVAVYER
jgi:hypothetical protein